MHRVHGYSLQTQIGPSRASEKLFTPRSLNHLHALSLQNWVGSQPPSLGQGVSFRTTKNQKTGRTDILAVVPGPRPDVDVRVASGHLRRNAKGFAFVDDGFVPPHLVESIPADVNDVTAVLVYAKHPKEERYGWRAVALSAG